MVASALNDIIPQQLISKKPLLTVLTVLERWVYTRDRETRLVEDEDEDADSKTKNERSENPEREALTGRMTRPVNEVTRPFTLSALVGEKDLSHAYFLTS